MGRLGLRDTLALLDPTCPFCMPAGDRVIARGDATLALWDAFPVTEGHALVVPARHVASIFELSAAEQAALWAEVSRLCTWLGAHHRVAAFTVGVNDGQASGQTVPHAHVHVIPRRRGDVPDPRGGVRWVVPARADYWSGS